MTDGDGGQDGRPLSWKPGAQTFLTARIPHEDGDVRGPGGQRSSAASRVPGLSLPPTFLKLTISQPSFDPPYLFLISSLLNSLEVSLYFSLLFLFYTNFLTSSNLVFTLSFHWRFPNVSNDLLIRNPIHWLLNSFILIIEINITMENIYCVEHGSVLSTLHIFSCLTPQHLCDIICISTITVIHSFHAYFLTVYFLYIRDPSILISNIRSDNRCCMISVPLDPEISAPCFMFLGMFQCLLAYNLWELKWNLYPFVMWKLYKS